MNSALKVEAERPNSPGPDPRSEEPTSNIACNDKDYPVLKGRNHQSYLDVLLRDAFAHSSDTMSNVSTDSADNECERSGRRLNIRPGSRRPSRSPALSQGTDGKVAVMWAKNKGLALVILSQLFGVMMNVTTRLLELDGDHGAGLHPFQVSHEYGRGIIRRRV